jgi:hypothetical protein
MPAEYPDEGTRPRSAARTILAIVVVAAVLAAAGYGAMRWTQSSIERQVDAGFATARTTLAVARYGHQEFHPLSRSMTLDDVDLQPRGGPTRAIRIRQLVLSGLPIFPTDTFSAGHIELADVTIDSIAGRGAHIARLTMDDVSATPIGPEAARLRSLAATAPPAERLPLVAAILEHVRIAKADMQEFTANEGADAVAIAAVHWDDLRNGKLAGVTLEGMRTVRATQTLTVERMSLHGLDVAGMLRATAQFAPPGAQPDPRQVSAAFRLLEDFEVSGLTGPDERPGQDPGQMFRISSFKASWGRYAGPTPTTMRFAMAMDVPIGPNETGPLRAMRDAGRKSVALAIDIGLAWNDTTRRFTLDPGAMTFDKLMSTSIVASVDNFPLDLLLVDPVQFTLAALRTEAGPLEFTIRDSGMLDFTVATVAKQQGVSAEAARKTMLANIDVLAASQQSPDIRRLAEAVSRFIATSNGSLRIALTPKGHVNIMEVLRLANIDPVAALARFTVEAGPAR